MKEKNRELTLKLIRLALTPGAGEAARDALLGAADAAKIALANARKPEVHAQILDRLQEALDKKGDRQ